MTLVGLVVVKTYVLVASLDYCRHPRQQRAALVGATGYLIQKA